MKVQVTMTVHYDEATTELSRDQHAQELKTSLHGAINNGLLTPHEPEAIVDEYALDTSEA